MENLVQRYEQFIHGVSTNYIYMAHSPCFSWQTASVLTSSQATNAREAADVCQGCLPDSDLARAIVTAFNSMLSNIFFEPSFYNFSTFRLLEFFVKATAPYVPLRTWCQWYTGHQHARPDYFYAWTRAPISQQMRNILATGVGAATLTTRNAL